MTEYTRRMIGILISRDEDLTLITSVVKISVVKISSCFLPAYEVNKIAQKLFLVSKVKETNHLC